MHPDDAQKLERMLGGAISVVPMIGGAPGSVRVTALDAVFPDELSEVIERLRTSGPRYHAGGPTG